MFTAYASVFYRKIIVEKERSQKILNTFIRKGNTYIDSICKTAIIEGKEICRQINNIFRKK